MSAEEVMRYEREGGYNPKDIYNENMAVRKVMTQLVNGYYSPDDPELFRGLYNALMDKDQYFILKDFDSYCEAHKRVDAAYRDEKAWARSAMLNTAKCGKFTSDRTIEQYAQEIWHLNKISVI